MHKNRTLKSSLREKVMPFLIKQRRTANRFRSLPDFIIIGTQKGGTSSLYYLLARHPCIVRAAKKEIHFFDNGYHHGISWYRSHFPFLWPGNPLRNLTGSPCLLTGEASPYYLFHPHAPRRTFHCVPEVKLIVLLRNPVDRAFSHYVQEKKAGREPLPFEEAIQKEEVRLKGEREKMMADENYYSFYHQSSSYLARGVYVDQLKAWRRFFAGEKMLILKSEDLFERPEETFTAVQEFLEVPLWFPSNYEIRNKGNSGPMNPETRKSLTEYFRPHNARLYEYLDRDFKWQMKSGQESETAFRRH